MKKIGEILTNGKVNISCEVFPPKQGKGLANAFEVVDKIAASHPSYISVTYGAGGSNAGETVKIAEHIEKSSLTALAHLTCAGAAREEIDASLQKLRAAGVRNILALRGDLNERLVCRAFPHAVDLVSYIKKQGDFCLGGAAYPEGHPESLTMGEDIEHTKAKVAAGLDFLVTQMFFDNNILYNYMFRLLRAGIEVPVVPGIMPVTSAAQIARICQLSGTKLPPNFRSMVERFADHPAALQQAGINYAVGQIIDLIANGFNNVHIYTMNKPQVFGGIMAAMGEIVK